MAANNIPTNIPDLFHLGKECLAGATAHGATIPLLINTSGTIGSARNNAVQLHADYRASLSQLPGLNAALRTARANGRAFASKARNWLENSLGSKWSTAWTEVGFDNNSLMIPKDDSKLEALLERMRIYFGNHAAQENPDPKVNVTSARAGTIGSALSAAVEAVNAKEEDRDTRKSGRDTALTGLRQILSGLVSELGQRLGDNDARWRRFGLNKPGAPTVPAVPSDVTVNTNTPGELLIKCKASANATHYRFFTQRDGLDAEPVFAGNSDEPMFDITGLTPGLSLQVFVTAVNSGAESRFSKPVTAVVGGEQEAAA